ncbi:hypothetical protein [Microbacterium sp. NPDC056234]|uniref:hypothetical protein n=1 Tax=Microbacterium sp. NPDC056234 TaxID=3345757 RepID=UPI0035E311DE
MTRDSIRHLLLLPALPALAVALAGCSVLGMPEPLDDEALAQISERVSDVQDGLDASVRADAKPCEGLCQRIFIDLVPRTPEYSAVDIALAIHEADTALEERSISSFEYCFHSNSWDLVDAQYLDSLLREIPALGYADAFRDEETNRPLYDCRSFAAIDGRELLESFLAEEGAPGF